MTKGFRPPPSCKQGPTRSSTRRETLVDDSIGCCFADKVGSHLNWILMQLQTIPPLAVPSDHSAPGIAFHRFYQVQSAIVNSNIVFVTSKLIPDARKVVSTFDYEPGLDQSLFACASHCEQLQAMLTSCLTSRRCSQRQNGMMDVPGS